MTIPYILLYLMIAIYFGSMYKIFEKAGRQKWEGFVPGYNLYIWLKIVNKPWWWLFFFPIPFVNLIIMVALNVETGRLFGNYDAKNTILSVLVPWYYIPYLAYSSEEQITDPTDWTKKEDREKRTLHDHITLFFMAPFVGHVILILFKILGSKDKPNKKTMPKEWTDALGFAIVAASIIRTFFFEAFTIPTGSMEKTMLIGDYLFVNKMKFGPKIPQTPLSVPFVHNRIPGTYIPSYVEWLKHDYHRLPGYGKIERGNIMVFNWPVGDTVILNDQVIAHDYYAILRDQAFVKSGATTYAEFDKKKDVLIKNERQYLMNGGGIIQRISPTGQAINKTGGLTTYPVDKKENYIKRCVGIAGDSLSIINGDIYINGQIQDLPPEAQFNYYFYFKDAMSGFNQQMLVDNHDIYIKDIHPFTIKVVDPNTDKLKDINIVVMTCTKAIAQQLSSYPGLDSVTVPWEPKGTDFASRGRYCPIFPNDPSFDWTVDNFGTLYIPKAGDKIEMNEKNYIIYKRAIHAYEGNTIEKKADGIYINGKKEPTYTFKLNYYWLMGDNRHNSVDSRYWGFVPEDHVVGTASFVWFSKHPEKTGIKEGIRWHRVFSFVK